MRGPIFSSKGTRNYLANTGEITELSQSLYLDLWSRNPEKGGTVGTGKEKEWGKWREGGRREVLPRSNFQKSAVLPLTVTYANYMVSMATYFLERLRIESCYTYIHTYIHTTDLLTNLERIAATSRMFRDT